MCVLAGLDRPRAGQLWMIDRGAADDGLPDEELQALFIVFPFPSDLLQ